MSRGWQPSGSARPWRAAHKVGDVVAAKERHDALERSCVLGESLFGYGLGSGAVGDCQWHLTP